MTDETISDGPVPKHRQVRDRIVELASPGQAIPSERELMTRLGVSRGTIRKAIDGLVSDGLLVRSLGRGTFATHPRVESRLHLASFSNDMRRRGLVPSTRLLSCGRRQPPPEVAAALGLPAAGAAWRIHRVRLADDEPIAVEDGWYPADLVPDLDQHDLVNESLYEILGRDYGLWIDRAEQSLWAETADAALARLLQTPLGAPLLVFQRTSCAATQTVEHVVSHYRGDRYQLHMSLEQPRTPE